MEAELADMAGPPAQDHQLQQQQQQQQQHGAAAAAAVGPVMQAAVLRSLPPGLTSLSVSGFVPDDTGLLDTLAGLHQVMRRVRLVRRGGGFRRLGSGAEARAYAGVKRACALPYQCPADACVSTRYILHTRPQLRRLYLVGMVLGGRGVAQLARLPHLEHISVDVLTLVRGTGWADRIATWAERLSKAQAVHGNPRRSYWYCLSAPHSYTPYAPVPPQAKINGNGNDGSGSDLPQPVLPQLRSLTVHDLIVSRTPLTATCPALERLALGDSAAGVESGDPVRRARSREANARMRRSFLAGGGLCGLRRLARLELWDRLYPARELVGSGEALGELVIHDQSGGRWSAELALWAGSSAAPRLRHLHLAGCRSGCRPPVAMAPAQQAPVQFVRVQQLPLPLPLPRVVRPVGVPQPQPLPQPQPHDGQQPALPRMIPVAAAVAAAAAAAALGAAPAVPLPALPLARPAAVPQLLAAPRSSGPPRPCCAFYEGTLLCEWGLQRPVGQRALCLGQGPRQDLLASGTNATFRSACHSCNSGLSGTSCSVSGGGCAGTNIALQGGAGADGGCCQLTLSGRGTDGAMLQQLLLASLRRPGGAGALTW